MTNTTLNLIAILLAIFVSADLFDRVRVWNVQYEIAQIEANARKVLREKERAENHLNCLSNQRSTGATEQEAQTVCNTLYGPRGVMR